MPGKTENNYLPDNSYLFHWTSARTEIIKKSRLSLVKMAEEENTLVVFQDKKIRRTWFNDEWWFSVVDIIRGL